jgi:HPt (histidine-containing phosphotransfer) domain-containing protein
MKINYNRLNEITGGDENCNAELMELFKQTVDKCYAILKAKDTDDGAWQAALHELKGATGNIGADELYRACKKFDGKKLTQEVKEKALQLIEERL